MDFSTGKATIELKNISANGDTKYDLAVDGAIRVFYEDSTGKRKPIRQLSIDNNGEMVGVIKLSEQWDYGTTHTITITSPTDRDRSKPYTLLFQGITNVTGSLLNEGELAVSGLVIDIGTLIVSEGLVTVETDEGEVIENSLFGPFPPDLHERRHNHEVHEGMLAYIEERHSTVAVFRRISPGSVINFRINRANWGIDGFANQTLIQTGSFAYGWGTDPIFRLPFDGEDYAVNEKSRAFKYNGYASTVPIDDWTHLMVRNEQYIYSRGEVVEPGFTWPEEASNPRLGGSPVDISDYLTTFQLEVGDVVPADYFGDIDLNVPRTATHLKVVNIQDKCTELSEQPRCTLLLNGHATRVTHLQPIIMQ